MKTTIELPDELLIEAKKFAAENRTTIRALVEKGLRRELNASAAPKPRRTPIRWVTVKGGLPAGLDIADRRKMTDWISRGRA